MENIEYVQFTNEDIIEALEDFYKKKTGHQIDIMFDEKNRELRSIKTITIKKSLINTSAEIDRVPGVYNIDYGDKAMAMESN